MSYWNLFVLTTREWIVVLYAVTIVFIVIFMITLIICIVRNCCYIVCTNDEEDVERDVIMTVPQQAPVVGQSSHSENSQCPVHGQKKYHNNARVHKHNLLVDDGHMTIMHQ
ncbi:Uncharacterized protein BM_BM1293 [Brugia malayi]|uniref:Bm1293 n=1 Tax=Brugia malayi TaxID=6279 RepID=A0A0K0IWB3_BRUMA|nr:Uncharacterized protein BM_BM1293 [Brugia malayi]CDP95227.1 Bm1293 [Brugia malayi]VIO92110.1 Uncharacterized protein BM_BM1293 [Brugia malayi]